MSTRTGRDYLVDEAHLIEVEDLPNACDIALVRKTLVPSCAQLLLIAPWSQGSEP